MKFFIHNIQKGMNENLMGAPLGQKTLLNNQEKFTKLFSELFLSLFNAAAGIAAIFFAP